MQQNTEQKSAAFGPAGNSESFYAQGFKRTLQAPAWIAKLGLNAFEYPAGRGVHIKEESACEIGNETRANGILMSIHAPYFINMANPDPERVVRNTQYFLDSARAVDWMGGDRVIFHTGSSAKREPKEAMNNACEGLRHIRQVLQDQGLGHIHLCPETMGRDNQLGTLDDIVRICELDESFIPNIDFAHMHARGRGSLNQPEDFDIILRRMIECLGYERVKHFHSHFCHIEYTTAGEKRHHRFSDTQFGPNFEHLAPCLVRHKLMPRIICESNGTMAEDALTMKELYEAALAEA